MSLRAIDPTTGEAVASYKAFTNTEASAAVEAAHRAFESWQRTNFEERAEKLLAAARILRERKDEYAELMAREMGKPLAAGRGEAEKCAWVCEYYADHAESMLTPEPASTEARDSFVAFRPLGVVLAVMPWNFPFWQVFRFAAPALSAGNAGVLKHAPNVPGCAQAIEEVFREAGFPPDLFRNLPIEVEQVQAIIEHPRVRAVTLTGSTRAGRSVAAAAGTSLKPTVLELGGSDPYIVLADADVDAAAGICVESRLINSGQSCIAAKRFVVVEAVRERFEEAVVEKMRAARVGNPFDEGVDVGPMARADLRDALHAQVEKSIAAGARCLLGGNVPEGLGFFYPATVLTEVGPGMPAYKEELFGPVAAILPVADEEEAIRVANDNRYGLGAAVFTGDIDRGRRLASERLEAGCCFVNEFVRSDPRLPFGGIKDSGYGRELGLYGIRSFVNVKTVYVA